MAPAPLPFDAAEAAKVTALSELTGTVPEGLKYLTNLEQWQLSRNHLSGTIPSWVGRIPHLKDLYLSHNQFEGPVPDFRRHETSVLRELSLDNNKLHGTIPASIAAAAVQYC